MQFYELYGNAIIAYGYEKLHICKYVYATFLATTLKIARKCNYWPFLIILAIKYMRFLPFLLHILYVAFGLGNMLQKRKREKKKKDFLS